jgi:hypothetical protein
VGNGWPDLIAKRGGEVRMRPRGDGSTATAPVSRALEVADDSGIDHEVPPATSSARWPCATLSTPWTRRPPEVIAAADRLKYRDFLIVTLVLNRPDPFPDNWIYVHAGEVKVGRIQNFSAWSPDMLPNDHQASIGMEYFCQKGEGLWTWSDDALRKLATDELAALGLAEIAGRGRCLCHPTAHGLSRL